MGKANAADQAFIDRACELARRGLGNTAPNPPVGAVVVRQGRILGEGYHHRAGRAHAEIEALHQAGDGGRDATLYVSLEPCHHQGRTPPCTHAIARAGITRVVAAARDPTTAEGGQAYLRDRGVTLEVFDDAAARLLVEPFLRAKTLGRPYVAIKMAASLDGYVASKPGVQEWLTGDAARAFVRELRTEYDGVAVGAGTIRVDNPRLTVRPAHDRSRPYQRIVLCGSEPLDPQSAVFSPEQGYAKTIAIVSRQAASRFRALERVADLIVAGGDSQSTLDLRAALAELHARGIASVLCEGGPTMASLMIAQSLADRLYWLVAPRLLHAEGAIRALSGVANVRLRFDECDRLGDDMLIGATVEARV